MACAGETWESLGTVCRLCVTCMKCYRADGQDLWMRTGWERKGMKGKFAAAYFPVNGMRRHLPPVPEVTTGLPAADS